MWLTLLLTNRYVQIAIAVVITAITCSLWGFWKGYSSEHTKRMEEAARYDAIIQASVAKSERIRTETAAELVRQSAALLDARSKTQSLDEAYRKAIKENEKLKRISVPRVAVELLNNSAAGKRPDAPVEKGPEGTGRTDAEASGSEADSDLRSVVETGVINNLNHLACVAQVEALQKVVCTLYDADGQPLEYEVCHSSP